MPGAKKPAPARRGFMGEGGFDSGRKPLLIREEIRQLIPGRSRTTRVLAEASFGGTNEALVSLLAMALPETALPSTVPATLGQRTRAAINIGLDHRPSLFSVPAPICLTLMQEPRQVSSHCARSVPNLRYFQQ